MTLHYGFQEFISPFKSLLIAVVFVVFSVQAAHADGGWQFTPRGQAEYRLLDVPEGDGLEIEIRKRGETNLTDEVSEFLILTTPPFRKPQVVRPVIWEMDAVHVTNGTNREFRRRSSNGDTNKNDDLRWNQFIRNVEQSFLIKQGGYMGRRYIVGLEWVPKRLYKSDYQWERVRVKISFEGRGNSDGEEADPRSEALTDWEQVRLERLIHNDADLDKYAVQPPLKFPYEADPEEGVLAWPLHRQTDAEWIVGDIDKEGLVGLQLGDIAIGLGRDITNLNRVRIWCDGREVPTLLLNDALYFWGIPSESRHTRAARYWVEIPVKEKEEGEEIEPRRIVSHEAPGEDINVSMASHGRQIIRLDRDETLRIRRDQFQSILDYRWIEGPADAATDYERDFDLPYPLPESIKRAKLRLGFFSLDPGKTFPGSLSLELNGEKLDTQNIRVNKAWEAEIELDQALFKSTGNKLTWTLDVTGLPPRSNFFDYLEIEYDRAFFVDQTPFSFELERAPNIPYRGYKFSGLNGMAPQMLALDLLDPAAPRSVAVQADAEGQLVLEMEENAYGRMVLTSLFDAQVLENLAPPPVDDRLYSAEFAAQKAENKRVPPLVVISHPEFQEAADKISAFHRGQGVTVHQFDAPTLYHYFGYGEPAPHPMRRMLSWAVDTWASPPGAILLIGDCSQDGRGDLKSGVIDWLPTFRVKGDLAFRPGYPSDFLYTCLLGDDNVADISISRISAVSPEDANAIVDKLIRYEGIERAGPWLTKQAIVTDDGEFVESGEEIRTFPTGAPDSFYTDGVFLTDYTWTNNYLLPQLKESKISSAATTTIRQTFEEGVAALFYFGHGSPNIWSDERMWFGGNSPNSDNLLLKQFPKLPMVIQMTCNTGSIDYPLTPWNVCMTEDMLRQPNGGALAVMAPGGLGVAAQHEAMAKEVRRLMNEAAEQRGLPQYSEAAPFNVGDLGMLAGISYLMQGNSDELLKMFILQGDPLSTLPLPQNGLDLELSGNHQIITSRVERNWELTVTQAAAPDQGGLPAGYDYLLKVTDPEGNIIENAGGKIEAGISNLKLSPNFAPDQPGIWNFYVTIWNETGGETLTGHTSIEVGAPDLLLTRFQRDPAYRPQDEETEQNSQWEEKLLIDLENRSSFGYEGALLIYEANAQAQEDSWKLHKALPLLLRAQGKQAFEEVVEPSYDISAWEIRITGRQGFPRPERVTTKGHLSQRVLSIDAQTAPEISLLQGFSHLEWYAQRRNLPQNINAQLLFARNISARKEQSNPPPLSVKLIGKMDEESWEMEAPVVIPSTGRDISSRVQLDADLAERLWRGGESILDELEFEVSLVPRARKPDDDPNLNFGKWNWRPGLQKSPQLKLLAVEVSPNNPTAGDTIFVKADIRNESDYPLTDIHLKLYESGVNGDMKKAPLPGLGEGLFPLADNPLDPFQLDWLAPGAEATLEARWDPFAPAGVFRAAALVDAEGSAFEPKRVDNLREFEINFKKPFELNFKNNPPVSIEIVDQRNRVVRLKTVIENSGESTADRVEVRFYKSREESENKKAEPLYIEEIPSLKPGEAATITYDWKLSRQETFTAIIPAAQAAIKGSRQKLSGASR